MHIALVSTFFVVLCVFCFVRLLSKERPKMYIMCVIYIDYEGGQTPMG